jgi:hypothetical protein
MPQSNSKYLPWLEKAAGSFLSLFYYIHKSGE